jgi:transcriptional regulator with XRE-family HTH domain
MELNIDALRKLRTEAGFTQEYMADAMKMTQSSYNRLENGKTRWRLEKHILPLANAIGKSTEEVFSQLIGCSVEKHHSIQHKQNIGLAEKDLAKQLFAEKELIMSLRAENTRLQLEIERLKGASHYENRSNVL